VVLLMALWLVGASFMVVLSPSVTHNLASAFVDTRSSSLSHDYLVQIADAARAFAVGDDAAGLPTGEDERVAFTPSVIQHLLDVRVVFQGAQVFTLAATLLLAALVVFLVRRYHARVLAPVLIGGGIIPLALALILVLVGLVSFDALFRAMHQMFFAAGTWTFSYNSLLICSLPLPFWMGCAVVWAVTLALLCIASIITGVLIRRSRTSIPPIL
jgi:integral membrane protein (TIGR01906 family)